MHSEIYINGCCLFCTDPREHQWREIKKQLILPSERFVSLGVLGGAIGLAYPDALPAEFNFLQGQIRFALKHFRPVMEFVVVGHDCGYYVNVPKRITLDDKKADTEKIAQFLRRTFNRQVRAFFYHNDNGTISFEVISGVPAPLQPTQ